MRSAQRARSRVFSATHMVDYRRAASPLLALSGHRFGRWTCLLSGVKRTSLIGWSMSA